MRDIDYDTVVIFKNCNKAHLLIAGKSRWTYTNCGMFFDTPNREFEFNQYRFVKNKVNKCKKCYRSNR